MYSAYIVKRTQIYLEEEQDRKLALRASAARVTKQIGPITVDPILKATLLRGQAQSRVAGNACTIGSDLAYGSGYAADVNLLNAGDDFMKALVKTSAPDPARSRCSRQVSGNDGSISQSWR